MAEKAPGEHMRDGLVMLWLSFKAYKGKMPESLAAQYLDDLKARESAWKASQAK